MGTNIGNNSIVGAGSVVKGNFPDGSIIAGNPARVIGNVENYYQKKSETENETITDIAGTKEFVFARNIITSTDQEYSKIFMQYNNDNTIDITYSSEKLTNDKQISTSSQKGKLKDNKFSCDIISGNNNNISCDIIKKEAENYHKEIEKIIKDNKINLNYVKTDAKKVTKF